MSAATVPIPPHRESELRPLTRHLRERGRAVSGPDFANAMAELNVHARTGIAASAFLILALLSISGVGALFKERASLVRNYEAGHGVGPLGGGLGVPRSGK